MYDLFVHRWSGMMLTFMMVGRICLAYQSKGFSANCHTKSTRPNQYLMNCPNNVFQADISDLHGPLSVVPILSPEPAAANGSSHLCGCTRPAFPSRLRELHVPGVLPVVPKLNRSRNCRV
jgi:hypothetical protein